MSFIVGNNVLSYEFYSGNLFEIIFRSDWRFILILVVKEFQ